MKIFNQQQRGEATTGISHHAMSWSLPETGGQSNSHTLLSVWRFGSGHTSICAWNAALICSSADLSILFLEMSIPMLLEPLWLVVRCWDVRDGCSPPPVGGCLLAAGQRAMWISCILLTLSASKECKDCSCCQRAVLCWETNVVWVNRVSGSSKIPPAYNSICVCHCPACLWVTVTFHSYSLWYVMRKTTILTPHVCEAHV